MNEEYYRNRCVQLDKKLDRVIDSHTKLEDKLKQYKSVLDEIREYIERQEVNSIGSFFADTLIGKDLLQILDKVNSDYNSENV